jgi:hypothetical protein
VRSDHRFGMLIHVFKLFSKQITHLTRGLARVSVDARLRTPSGAQ